MNSPLRTRRAQREFKKPKMQSAMRNFSMLELRNRNFPFVLRVVCVLCVYLLSRAGGADAAPQQVVPVEGPAYQADLISIDANGRVTFRAVDPNRTAATSATPEIRTIALSELVRWGNPVAPRTQTIVLLSDGSRIITAADWAGGAAVRLVGDDVELLSDTWNEVRLQRGLVAGIVLRNRTGSKSASGCSIVVLPIETKTAVRRMRCSSPMATC